MTTRKELIEAVGARYRTASTSERTKILDEFVAVTGYHRKHAIRVLGSGSPDGPSTRSRNRLYDEAVRQALIVLWEAGDRVCGKRLKVLIPILVDAMERHGHLQLDPAVRTKLLQVSAATYCDWWAPSSRPDQGFARWAGWTLTELSYNIPLVAEAPMFAFIPSI